MLKCKTLVLFLVLSVISMKSFCQEDSTDIDDDDDKTEQIVQINKITPRKKGVYKTYEEYISNSPSIEAEFTVKPLQISRNNTLIAEAKIKYKKKRPKNIWGVSDGQYVYLRMMSGQLYQNHYFRLQCDGPRPYIYFVDKTTVIATGLGAAVLLTVAATTAALPPFVSLMIVREETNYFKPTVLATNNRVKRLLEEYPDLLEEYKNEPNHNKATKAKYLTEYNVRLLKK